MPRKKHPLNRDGGVLRDASLVVIASEDTYAVESYFRRFRSRKVQFVVLPTQDGQSDPVGVLERLNQWCHERPVEEQDEFWICIDLDHWADSEHIHNLVQVIQQCRQKGYHIAINNPCVELWFLLHFAEYVAPTNANRIRCHEAVAQLEAATGQKYYKEKCDRLKFTVAGVHDALRRAKALDSEEGEIPQSVSARIYRIVEMLQQRDGIDLPD